MKSPRVYLHHILECIGKIERYARNDESYFLAEPMVQDAVFRVLQTMAASTQRLPDNLKESHPEVDWRAIAGFRNVLVHDYLEIKLRRVWQLIAADLPVVRLAVEAMLDELEGTHRLV